jgi:hypothetical protein
VEVEVAEEKPNEVFVISPIDADRSEVRLRSDKVLEFIIREALPGPGFVVRRGDQESSPDKITSLVVKRIREADLVVADITGHNPNVFYELAIAHGYERPVIHLGQKGEELPFDIADMRTIFYDVTDLYSVRDCVAKVKSAAETALADPAALKTPLTGLDAFSAIREQATPGSADELIASTLQKIQTKLDRLEYRLERGRDLMETGDLVPARDRLIKRLLDGPVVFTKDYVSPGQTTYQRGTHGVVTQISEDVRGRITDVDIRIPDAEHLVGVPIEYLT